MIAPQPVRRMAIAFIVGLLVSACPITLRFTADHGLTLGHSMAHAKDGDDGGGDNSGSGNSNDDRDDRDDRDDNSGPGNRNDDDDDDDDDDDKRGRGIDGIDDDNRPDNRRNVKQLGARDNIRLRYSNGWRERIQRPLPPDRSKGAHRGGQVGNPERPAPDARPGRKLKRVKGLTRTGLVTSRAMLSGRSARLRPGCGPAACSG